MLFRSLAANHVATLVIAPAAGAARVAVAVAVLPQGLTAYGLANTAAMQGLP